MNRHYSQKLLLSFFIWLSIALWFLGCATVERPDTAHHSMYYVTDRVPYMMDEPESNRSSHTSLLEYAPTADSYTAKQHRKERIEHNQVTHEAYGSFRDANLNYGKVDIKIVGNYVNAATGPAHGSAESLMPLETWSQNRYIDRSNRVTITGPAAIQSVTDFYQDFKNTLNENPPGQILIFVHGFNTTFAQGARRGFKLGQGLDLCATTILYSWPSQGRWYKYLPDSTNVLWSTLHLYKFLGATFKTFDRASINIVVHSMGSQAVSSALWLFSEKESLPDTPLIRNLIFAAPDIDADIFAQMLPGLTRIAERITIYRSTRDQALSWSNFFHIFPRLGQIAGNLLGSLSSLGSAAGDFVTSMPGVNQLESMDKFRGANLKLTVQSGGEMDTLSLPEYSQKLDIVDVSEVDSSFGGHSYLEFNPWVQYDMYRLVRSNASPAERGLIERRDERQNLYWEIPKR